MADIQEVGHNFSTAAVTITTTTEKDIITSPLIAVVRQSMFAMVIAWCQLATGAATTAVTTRMRRGSGIGGDIVGDASAQIINAAAAQNESFNSMVGEELTNVSEVQYTFTLQQADATGNGSVTQAAILVLLM